MQWMSAAKRDKSRMDWTRSLNASASCGTLDSPNHFSFPIYLPTSTTPESTSMAVQTASSTSQQVQIEYQILNGPAGTPPAGVISNFDNPPNLDVYLNLTLILCLILASLAVFTRMYTKILLVRSVGYEDCECSNCISFGSDILKLLKTLL